MIMEAIGKLHSASLSFLVRWLPIICSQLYTLMTVTAWNDPIQSNTAKFSFAAFLNILQR